MTHTFVISMKISVLAISDTDYFHTVSNCVFDRFIKSQFVAVCDIYSRSPLSNTFCVKKVLLSAEHQNTLSMRGNMKRSITPLITATLLALFTLCFTHLAVQAQVRTESTAPAAIVQVVAGSEHACALTRDGHVLCWGSRYSTPKQLPFDQPTPLTINEITEPIVSLAAGGFHTCGVTSLGHVQCWGWNNYGVLGGQQTMLNPVVEVTSLPEAVRMAALGNLHSCVLTVSGGVKCWGSNREGELGNNSDDQSYLPVDVIGLKSGVRMIEAGSNHTCALTDSDEVFCWGENDYGQLGDGTITISHSIPVKVNGLSGVSSISVGGQHTCALLGGKAKCWGKNAAGQLGSGSDVISSSIPIDVVGLSNVQEVAAYANHSCALLSTGAVRCWGDNGYGQLGNGTQISTNVPVEVVGLDDKAVSLGQGGQYNIFASDIGGKFSCAVLVNGSAQCWGENYEGQLGNGLGGESSGSAVNVLGLENEIAQITVGATHSCALRQNQTVQCWGSNEWGQLGDGTFFDRSTPVTVTGISDAVTKIVAGNGYSCALTSKGAVQCWGKYYRNADEGGIKLLSSSVPFTVTGLSSDVTMIALTRNGYYTGDSHSCVVDTSGSVKCWGRNYRGELGDGTTIDRSQPVAVVGLNQPALTVVVGYGFTCVQLADGSVKCWGDNSAGQLGDGTFVNSKKPVQTVGLFNPIHLVSGSNHSCAISRDNQVLCWGSNSPYGQLGDGTTIARGQPTQVLELPGKPIGVAAGDLHTCALLADNSVYCWGANNKRQLGSTLQAGASLTPVWSQSVNRPVTQISSGGLNTCVLLQTGTVSCWGDNSDGQLGNGGAWSTTPTAVLTQHIYLPILVTAP